MSVNSNGNGNLHTYPSDPTDPLLEACMAYLESLNCTLWGRSYDIKTGKSTNEAAIWLRDQFLAVQALMFNQTILNTD